MIRPMIYLRNAGFTMVEMLISVAVFVIVLTLAFTTLIAANEVRRAAAARIDIYQNARAVLAILAQDLRSARLAESDLRFSAEIDPTSGVPVDLNEPNNGRGRMLINDWPPERSSAQGVDVNDARIYSGDGVDNDNDGTTDEEAFDGLDNDGDGEPQSPTHPVLNVAMADGLDNNNDGRVDEGIDEDIYFPKDMINFVTVRGQQEVEVGYGIDAITRRDLLRRSAFFSSGITGNPPQGRLDGIYPIALQYAQGQYDPVPGTNPPLRMPWFDYDFEPGVTANDRGEAPRLAGQVRSNGQGQISNEDSGVAQVYEIVALNILGFDCKAYYYDYLLGEENSDINSPGQRALIPSLSARLYNPYSFPALAWDSSYENASLVPRGIQPYVAFSEIPIFPNEPEDLAIIEGTQLFIANSAGPGSTQIEQQASQRERVRLATQRTDGFPRVIELTLFVQDNQRLRDDPVRVSTRIMIPFGVGEEDNAF